MTLFFMIDKSYWNSMREKIKKRRENEEIVKKNGGDVFQQLEARLMDVETGKLGEDIVIYGIRTINDKKKAQNFLQGYISDVSNNLEKYPLSAKEDPKGYAVNDLLLALNMHFYSSATHEFWNSTVNEVVK